MTKKIITVKCKKSMHKVNVVDFKKIHYIAVKVRPQIPKFLNL